jgi:hypothetical protein
MYSMLAGCGRAAVPLSAGNALIPEAPPGHWEGRDFNRATRSLKMGLRFSACGLRLGSCVEFFRNQFCRGISR